MDEDDGTPITPREWTHALFFSLVGGVLVTVLIAWFASSFVFRSCGYGPACA